MQFNVPQNGKPKTLCAAAGEGKLNLVVQLVEQGAEVNLRNKVQPVDIVLAFNIVCTTVNNKVVTAAIEMSIVFLMRRKELVLCILPPKVANWMSSNI